MNINNNPNPDSNPFNDLASAYDAWFDAEGKLIFEIEVQAFQEVLPSLPEPWLEIGVGSGRFARALGINTGVEPSIKLVDLSRKRGITTYWGRGEQRVFEENSFGTVFLITTLCFLRSPLKVLKEAYRILQPGGKIVLGVVLKDSPWGKYYQQKKIEEHPFYKEANFYHCNELTRLTIQAKFTGERIISSLFQQPGEVTHMEYPKEGLYLDAGFVIIVAEKPHDELSPQTNTDQDIEK